MHETGDQLDSDSLAAVNAQTDDEEETSNSAAQPVANSTEPQRAEISSPADEETSSNNVAQLVASTKTPRVNTFFLTDDVSFKLLQEVLEYIVNEHLLCSSEPDFMQQLESLLEVIEEQRAKHLHRNPHLCEDTVFTDDHMQQIENNWMYDYKACMDQY